MVEDRGGHIARSDELAVLANVYLHYVFDLWVEQWRKRHAQGEVIVVRHADDFVVGFQYEVDATRSRRELEERLQKFCMELHRDKTRLLGGAAKAWGYREGLAIRTSR